MRRFLCALLLTALSATAHSTQPHSSHEIRVEIDPGSGILTLDDQISVSGMDGYRFRLAKWMAPPEIRVGNRKVTPLSDGENYYLALGTTGDHTIRIKLSGRLPEAFPARDRSLPSGAVSSPEGTYLPGYAGWLPHDPSTAISYELSARVPNTYRILATGIRTGEEAHQHYYQASFRSRTGDELPLLLAGPYRVQEQKLGNIELRTYFHSELANHAQDYLDAVAGYLKRFSALIGDYPYQQFYVVSAPLPVGLGYPGIAYMSRRIIPYPFIKERSLAHEVMHSYWGNGVAVDYQNGNWAEGLTTYLADYALAKEKGEQAALDMRARWLRDYAALPASRETSVRDFVARRHDAAQVIGYNKVAYLFHMLSREIGEDKFGAGLKDFWSGYRFKTAGWAEIESTFEARSGRNLDEFFAQWLDRTGAPGLELDHCKADPEDAGFVIRFELVQTEPLYRLSIPVEITTTAGVETHHVELAEGRRLIELKTASRSLQLAVDPAHHVFRRLGAGEAPPILRDVFLSPEINLVLASDNPAFIQAAHQLTLRVMDTPPDVQIADQAIEPGVPTLLIGERAGINQTLSRLRLTRPDLPGNEESTAAVWSTYLEDGSPAVVIEADNNVALTAINRSLPHYSAQSHLQYTDSKVLQRGVWPINTDILECRL